MSRSGYVYKPTSTTGGVTVRMPRFRIVWIMVAVAIAALDFALIRVVLDGNRPVDDLLALGALPTANILAVGILVGRQHPGSRPFLLGFEAFGAVALTLYVVLVCF